MSTELISYAAPILTASIAGAVAFLVSVLSKEQKTSEFRQAWIDQLRNDLADLTSLVLMTEDAMAHMVSDGNAADLPAYIIQSQDKFIKITACAMRIEMRLNPDEHLALMDLVRKIGTSVKTFRGNTDASAAAASLLLIESQKVLKQEWLRVKRGENIFHFTKCISLVLLISGAIIFLAVGGFQFVQWLRVVV